jgi:hypothetical protein
MSKHNRGRRSGWVIGGLVVMTSVGVAAWLIGRNDATVDQNGYAPVVTLSGVVDGAPIPTAATPAVASAAPSPAEAVTRYLDAEIAGRTDDSYAQLSSTDRSAVGDAEDWQIAADDRPDYQSYEVVDAAYDQVVVDARPTPMVSEIKGVAPERERIEFAINAEDGGYRIGLAETTFSPSYPAPEAAAGVATQWVAGQQACTPAASASLEYDGNLLGTLDLGPSLCGATGQPEVVRSGDLGVLTDPSTVLSAFGEPATEWTRIVEVGGLDGRAPVQVILAPYGDRWVVVGGLATVGAAPG